MLLWSCQAVCLSFERACCWMVCDAADLVVGAACCLVLLGCPFHCTGLVDSVATVPTIFGFLFSFSAF